MEHIYICRPNLYDILIRVNCLFVTQPCNCLRSGVTEQQIVLLKHPRSVISFAYAASDAYQVYRRFGSRHGVPDDYPDAANSNTKRSTAMQISSGCLSMETSNYPRRSSRPDVSLICLRPLRKCAFSSSTRGRPDGSSNSALTLFCHNNYWHEYCNASHRGIIRVC